MRYAIVVQEGFGITLDRHALRTPSRNPLVLPTKALALAVAAEWRWQVMKTMPEVPCLLP